jgi:hypothetical protein
MVGSDSDSDTAQLSGQDFGDWLDLRGASVTAIEMPGQQYP